jgi:hypothetical protein
MKQRIFLAVTFFCFASMVSAQLRFGVKGGGSISTLSTTSSLVDEVNSITTWRAGIVMQYKIFNFAIQPELLFTTKGGDLDNSGLASGPLGALTDNASTVSYLTHNLEIPVNFQYGMEMGPGRVFAQAGPYLSIVLDGKINGSGNIYDDVDDSWNLRRVDLGFGIGAGAELSGFQLSLQYDFGGTRIGDEVTTRSVNVDPFYDMKSRNLSLSLAYLF